MKRTLFIIFILISMLLFAAGIAYQYNYIGSSFLRGTEHEEHIPLLAFVLGFMAAAVSVFYAYTRIRELSDKIRVMSGEISNLSSQTVFFQQQIPQLKSDIESLSTMREISLAININVEFEKILEQVLRIMSQMTGASVLDIFLANMDEPEQPHLLKAHFSTRGSHGYVFIYFEKDPEMINFPDLELGDFRSYTGDNYSIVDTTLQDKGLVAGSAKMLSRSLSPDPDNQKLYLKQRMSSFEINKENIQRAIDVKNIIRVQQGRTLQFTAPLIAEKEVHGVIKMMIEQVTSDKDPEFLEQMLKDSIKHISLAIKKADLYEKAVKDGLTNLYNKVHFISQLNIAIALAQSDNKPFTLLMFDIDHFKNVNDTYGHLTGDMILKGVSNILKRNLREQDMAFRYGGEELAIILNDTGIRKGTKVANRIRKAVKEKIFTGEKGDKIHVTISIGVSQYYIDAMSGPESLISRTDEGLYLAKERGRDRVVMMKKPK